MNNHTFLVVLAHPDDESFPMGGTIAKAVSEGIKVILICATRGESGIPNRSPAQAGEIRSRELQCAGDKLGMQEIRFLDYQDGALPQVDAAEIIERLSNLMQEYQPRAVITFGPEGISGHPDHRAISSFTTRAFERAGLSNSRLFYLAPSEATLQGCGVAPSQDLAGGPVTSVDITAYRETKLQAIQCHASQNPPFQGSPKEEVAKMACHEYFVLARPSGQILNKDNLFEEIGSK